MTLLQTWAVDLRAAAPALRGRTGGVLALGADENDADMVFVGFEGRPRVLVGPPAALAPEQLANIQTLITVRVADPPADAWIRTFKGRQISVFERRGPP